MVFTSLGGSAVVIHELQVGAKSPGRLRDLRRGLVEPFRSRRRIHAPGLLTWELASEIDRQLRRRGGYEGSLQRRSFANDILLAATARELDAVLVTRNLADFEIIAQVPPFRFAAPWPALDAAVGPAACGGPTSATSPSA